MSSGWKDNQGCLQRLSQEIILKPTTTTNPLHFEDLDLGRFEDLCLEIANRYKSWL